MESAVAGTSINTTSTNYQGSSTDLAVSLSGGCDWSGDGEEDRTPNSYSNPNRNSSGFSALPAGRYVGGFSRVSEEANFWSSTSAEENAAYSRELFFPFTGVSRSSSIKQRGYSVRCVRDISGVTMGAVSKTDSTGSTLRISAAYTTTKTVTSASICAYTDAECTTAAGICAADVAYSTSPITGTITGLNANTQYYVKVTATTAGGTASTRAGLFGTAAMDTISFVANGGTGTMTEQVVNRGTTVAIPTNAFTHDGNWIFTGWNDACDGNGTHYADGANITTSGNVTLYAQWHTFCTGTPTDYEMGSARIDSVKDHQNNWYRVVQIGNQCWLKENMRCSTSPKRYLTSGGSAANSIDAYYYNDTAATQFSLRERGYLYNWAGAVDTIDTNAISIITASFTNRRGICPEGWHIPTDAEWQTLEVYTGICTSSTSGTTGLRGSNAGRLTGGCDWADSSATTAPGNYSYSERNSSGFSALPAGMCYGSNFDYAGEEAYFWSATTAYLALIYSRILGYGDAGVDCDRVYNGNGLSVRCVRDVSGVTMSDVTKTDSTSSTLSISAAYTTTKTVTSASICAYTDAECTTAAGICAADVAYSTSPITGTITGLNANTQYYVKVTATTAGGTASTRAGLFGTAAMDTISFVANGGTGTMTEQVVNRGTAVAIPTNAFTHDGNWNFTGWDDACDGNGTHYADGANITTSGNVTLYAQWHTFCTGTPTNCELGSARIDSVKDHQDNWYKVVQIGNQCWLKENMRCSTSPKRYLTSGGSATSYLDAYYYNDTADTQFSLRERGYLYNWVGAMDSAFTSSTASENVDFPNRRGICPQGWHLPTDAEWQTLEVYTGICTSSTAGTTGWRGSNAGRLTGGCDWFNGDATTAPGNYSYSERNQYGFSALPAGFFYSGEFNARRFNANFWSATSYNEVKVWSRMFRRHEEGVCRQENYYSYGFSVRCVRD